MASRAGLSGLALGEIALGLVLAWSGIENKPVWDAVRSLAMGQAPTPGPAAPASSSTGGPAFGALPNTPPAGAPLDSGTQKGNQALGRIMAGAYGWATGQDWQALNYGWGTLESGWSATARNPSGAYGIAQALGHGNSNTAAPDGTNEYGGLVPDSVARAANEGQAWAQIEWGLAYIHSRYGKPSNVPGWLGQGGYQGY